MEEDDIFEADTDLQLALEDNEESEPEATELQAIVRHVMERYRKAEDTRRQDEDRWLQAYRNYRGIYGPDVQFTDAEKSRVFIKVTKTKTLAAYGQIIDVLFAGNKFPITVEPTKLPEGVSEAVHFDMQPPQAGGAAPVQEGSVYGFEGDGQEFPAGATANSLREMKLGVLQEKLSEVDGLQEG